uniref:Signal peptidase complex catalytic subunit SEC11 n=1 Tax=Oryza nivara TaxID=4536 RepID=A0A0E0HNY6_ORYNI
MPVAGARSGSSNLWSDDGDELNTSPLSAQEDPIAAVMARSIFLRHLPARVSLSSSSPSPVVAGRGWRATRSLSLPLPLPAAYLAVGFSFLLDLRRASICRSAGSPQCVEACPSHLATAESCWREMGFIGDTIESIRSMQVRQVLAQIISLGMIVTSALIIWKGLIVVTGSESPVVVVLSGSMEPGFKRGDILFLHMSKDPIRTGEIVVFNVDGREIPIVHRVIKNSFLPYVGWVTIIMTEKPIIKYLLIGALGLLVITSKE